MTGRRRRRRLESESERALLLAPIIRRCRAPARFAMLLSAFQAQLLNVDFRIRTVLDLVPLVIFDGLLLRRFCFV